MKGLTTPGSQHVLQLVDTFSCPKLTDNAVAQLVPRPEEPNKWPRWWGEGLKRCLGNGLIDLASTVPQQMVASYTLQCYSHDTPILEELGGEDAATVDFMRMIHLAQEELLTGITYPEAIPVPQKGCTIAYIRLTNGELAVVSCLWHNTYRQGHDSQGWWIDINEPERTLLHGPRLWSQGFRVIAPADHL